MSVNSGLVHDRGTLGAFRQSLPQPGFSAHVLLGKGIGT